MQNSDSKSNRPTVSTTNQDVKPISNSTSTTPNSAKFGKGLRTKTLGRTKAIEDDRFKAAV